MKQELHDSKVYLNHEELDMLVKEVKETVAAEISLEKEIVTKKYLVLLTFGEFNVLKRGAGEGQHFGIKKERF